MTDDDALNATFAALAHPTRRAILAHLAQGKATVNDLAEPFQMSLPAVSKHIRVLENAGLITKRWPAGQSNTVTYGKRGLMRWTDFWTK